MNAQSRSRAGPESVARAALPVPLTTFVGREREVADLRELLRRSRLATLTGPGGVGKTRLAIEVVRRRGARSAGDAVFVDLGAVSDDAAVPGAVAASLGLSAADPSAAEAVLAEWLGRRTVLLVLDNCEHVVRGCASLAAELLGRCPGLRVLATSRESLGVPGEAVWMLAPLNLDEARRLFLARARESRAAVDFGAGGDDAVLAICRRLEGIPLALELAAAQLAVLSPAEIVPLLADRLAAESRRLAPARQQTLRASIEWSFELLEPAERSAFARLSVFTGAFGRDAASEVAGADISSLAALAAKSMIYVVEDATRTRYRLLDMLRAYGVERLREANEEVGARERHLAWWVARAEAVCGRGTRPASAEGFEQLCEDIDDLRGALRFAVERSPDTGLRLMASTRELWYRMAQAEGLERCLRFLALCPDLGADRAYALIAAGRLAITVQDHALADRVLAEALSVAARARASGIEPLARFLLGVSLFLSARLDEAERELERAAELYGALDDRCGNARSSATRGVVAFFRGDWQAATDLLERALATLIAENDRWGEGLCHTYLGLSAREAGRSQAAERHLLRAMERLAPVRDVAILGIALAAYGALELPRAPRRALVLAAAAAARDGAGGRYAPRAQADIDRVRADATRRLGADKAADAWEQGSRLLFAQAADLALARPSTPKPARPGGLTKREHEIADLVVAGLTNAQVAQRLQLSPRTVENHVAHSLAKLGARNRTELAARLAGDD